MRKIIPIILCFTALLLTACQDQTVPGQADEPDLSQYESLILDITGIEADAFTGKLPWPYPCVYTVRYALEDQFCVGDRIMVYYSSLTEDETAHTASAWTATVDAAAVQISSFKLDPDSVYMPVIYLYPEEETQVHLRLDYHGTLTHTCPIYQDGWQITAQPDGRLTDAAGRTYPYLFWEGTSSTVSYDMSRGFCVKGADTAAFLTESLAMQGLNEGETEDFLAFWLPYMEHNPYNLIAFQGDAYERCAKLTPDPAPDTVIRVFMAFTPLEESVDIPPQTLSAPPRNGFTLVEWGGSIVPNQGLTLEK